MRPRCSLLSNHQSPCNIHTPLSADCKAIMDGVWLSVCGLHYADKSWIYRLRRTDRPRILNELNGATIVARYHRQADIFRDDFGRDGIFAEHWRIWVYGYTGCIAATRLSIIIFDSCFIFLYILLKHFLRCLPTAILVFFKPTWYRFQPYTEDVVCRITQYNYNEGQNGYTNSTQSLCSGKPLLLVY